MNAAVGLMDGLSLDGDRCIRVIPRHKVIYILHSPNLHSLTDIVGSYHWDDHVSIQEQETISVLHEFMQLNE